MRVDILHDAQIGLIRAVQIEMMVCRAVILFAVRGEIRRHIEKVNTARGQTVPKRVGQRHITEAGILQVGRIPVAKHAPLLRDADIQKRNPTLSAVAVELVQHIQLLPHRLCILPVKLHPVIRQQHILRDHGFPDHRVVQRQFFADIQPNQPRALGKMVGDVGFHLWEIRAIQHLLHVERGKFRQCTVFIIGIVCGLLHQHHSGQQKERTAEKEYFDDMLHMRTARQNRK